MAIIDIQFYIDSLSSDVSLERNANLVVALLYFNEICFFCLLLLLHVFNLSRLKIASWRQKHAR